LAYTRKNQRDLSTDEWTRFVAAIHRTHGMGIPAPRYRDFVRVHVEAMNPLSMDGMSWGVHTMGPMMRGRNFLAWHRRFLVRLEERLRQVDSSVTLPYWDWISDRSMPAPLNRQELLREWGVTRDWDPSQLPTDADLEPARNQKTFETFQPRLEQVHNFVHNAVGGTMAASSSPADPLFWLHHANIDRLWAEWERRHPRAVPPNINETLKPRPLFGVKVSTVLDIKSLGYGYA
jgi:tyrosinase